MNQRRVSNKVKQRQLQTKFLEQQTKKMQDKLSQLKKQVQQQKQLKATNNFQKTVTRWKNATRSDAPLKSYAKQILQQQKQAYKKFGIDQKKITGTKTFSTIKKRLKQQKQLEQQKNPKKIPSLMSKTSGLKERQNTELPIQIIQNNFFKAKMDIKNLIKQKTVLQFLQQIFLQQYFSLFEQNNITQLGDLRFLSRQQLDQMGILKGHQVKILKKIKEQFQKSKSPYKMTQNNHQQKDIQSEPTPKTQKKMVQMGYGQGNINDYANIQASENQLLIQAQQHNPNQLEENFEQVRSQDMSQGQQNDTVMITVPFSQIALQTGDDYEEEDQMSKSIAQNCFNCYKMIPLKNQLFKSPDNRNFCSANCLKVYHLQMQKTCPECHKQFFKTKGYYQEGFWFCSIGCCPNKDQIQQMFLQWTQKGNFQK